MWVGVALAGYVDSVHADVLYFKQKTAYEVLISDLSSHVCSSDLIGVLLAFSGVTGLLVPQYVIGRIRKLRLQRFDEQLPDLLQALAGALRAGAGLHSALTHIVAHSPAPLSPAFGLIDRNSAV